MIFPGLRAVHSRTTEVTLQENVGVSAATTTKYLVTFGAPPFSVPPPFPVQGEAGYSMRLMDIRTLKLKCGDLMRDLAISRGSSNQMDELRREVFQLQRDLLQVFGHLLDSGRLQPLTPKRHFFVWYTARDAYEHERLGR